ncbi:MAG: hypothetical protein PHE88_02025 [Elusimicrobia bacterium]|nr:hypothetical protein [Elusimicrobiota bacterium]
MSDQYNPVLSNGDVQIDCDNDASSSSNVIKFTHDSGTELVRIQEDGKVGIGTASPYGRLRVQSGSEATPLELTTSDFNSGTNVGSLFHVEFGAATGNTYTKLAAVNNGWSQWSNLILQSGGGSVGIGTTSPYGTLRVQGSSTATPLELTTSDFNSGTNTGSLFHVLFGASTGNTYTELGALNTGWSAWSDLILQSGGGKVGIGTTSPAEKLEVNGNIKASGAVAAGNEGLKWKVYSHTLTSNEVTNKYCEISNVTIENENVRGMLCGGNSDGQYHFVAYTQDYGTARYWISADLNDNADIITLYFGSSFVSGAVLYVIVFYV